MNTPHTAPHEHPFLVADPLALRRRISGLTGVWQRRWQRFCAEARREQRSVRWYNSSDTPMHAALIAFATGDAEFIAIAKRDLAWMADTYEGLLAVGAQDMDTWIHAAPMARRAIACDWMWPWLSADERARYAELFVRDSLRYPYVVLHHRTPPHANNQGAAQALNLVTVGHLFGVRHGDDPRARHLLATGLPHLLQQVALLPPDAYAGEGSTYEVSVAAPLMALACAVVEASTGADLFTRPFAPCGNTFAQALGLSPRLVPPSQVLPGWDQHGFHLAKPGTTLAYLAHRSGEARWYGSVSAGDGWRLGGSFAWQRDDHVWQWLWMPEPSEAVVSTPFAPAWAEPRIGGTLVESGNLHLFQYWDIVGSFPVRAHCNPNAVQLEAFGSLLTVDGNPADDYALAKDERLMVTWWACDPPVRMSWAGGSIASHSAVCIDDCVDLRGPDAGIAPDPTLAGCGHLLRHESAPGLAVVAADAAACYRGRFNLHHAVRSSALVDDAFWVMHDDLADNVPHDWRWQLVLRAGAVATPWGARVTTAEHVVLDVIPLEGADAATLVDIAGYPSVLEKRCHHYRRTVHGSAASWTTVLIPRLAREQLADWTAGWSGTWEGGTSRAMDLEQVWMETADHPAAACTWERSVELPAGDDLLLELPRTYAIEAWLDNAPLAVPELGHYHSSEPICQSPFVALPAGPARRASLRLRFSKLGGTGPTGRIALHRRIAVPPPEVAHESDRLSVRLGARVHLVDLARVRTAPRAIPQHSEHGDDPLAAAGALLAPLRLSTAGADPAWWSGSDADKSRACISAVLRTDRTAEMRILPLLADPSWDVRLAAAAALVHVGSGVAVPALTAAFAAETPERVADKTYGARYRVREMCILALHRIGDPSVRPLLEACLVRAEFYGVRRVAAQALRDLGTMASLPALQAWTGDADAETAAAARAAIAAISGANRS